MAPTSVMRGELRSLGNGNDDLDEEFAAQGDVGIGATIMGRNMFGPVRSEPNR
jgi:hypothetical protein